MEVQGSCTQKYIGNTIYRKVWSQELPGVTGKFGLGVQNVEGQRLIEFCKENALVIGNTLFQQHRRRLYTWSSPDCWHQNQIDYIICSQRCWSSIQSPKTRQRADCDSDHELLIAKIQTLIEESRENHQTIQVWPKSNPLRLIIQWKWEIDLKD